MADKNVGKIIQVISAVLDIKFSEGNLPEINDAVEVPLKNGGKLVVEVAQHLGDDTVRCIAMGPTDGLVRGMDAIATGAPISVPVGENTLGRMFNVLGEPIDEVEPPQTEEKFALPIPEGWKNRTLRRCRSRKDGAHPGAYPQHRYTAWWILSIYRCRRAYTRGK